MAGSKFAYVKSFELTDQLLPGVSMILRVDGHAFHRFSDVHGFKKPNDERALKLMDRAAQDLMDEYKDIVLAFGESDEFSFLLRKSTSLYNRRQAKIVTTLTSLFTASYVLHWNQYLPEVPLIYPPSFDGRIVLYPGVKEVRDYFSWRQADTHINNLYNTTFWALVQDGANSTKEAHSLLSGTTAKVKNEILFKQFGINYNNIDPRFRKGSIVLRAKNQPFRQSQETSSRADGSQSSPKELDSAKSRKENVPRMEIVHVDIIKDEFWEERPWLLGNE